MLVPPAVRPGDLIDVVAPSSPFDHALAWRGLGWLSERFQVRYDRRVFDVAGYLAGSDERRIDELNRALRCPTSKAIVAMRGGYGLNRIAHRLDWDAFRSHAKWLIGFSDITALHVEAANLEVATIHGPMLAMLGRGHATTRASWLDALEHPTRPRDHDNLVPVLPGRASGTSFGGNLAMLHACAAANRLHVPREAVLFLEDVGERPYRIDRTLTTLIVGGHFDCVSAIVLGEFTECFPGKDGTCVENVLRDCLAPLGVPVVAGFPIGHGLNNVPVHFGMTATVHVAEDSASVTLNG